MTASGRRRGDRTPAATPATAPRPTRRRIAAVRGALLHWFDRQARDLPWRATRDPYAIWIAETMLQQTRIEVVRSRWSEFLVSFPDVTALARASENAVLAAWSGLGYYSRARALRRAAIAIRDAHGGHLPSDPAALRSLPGIGAYTSAAVLSIARDVPLAAVDGNVVRVLSRWHALGLPAARGEPHASLADTYLARERPGAWNQAVMELGETLCTPRGWDCGACPVARWCEASAAGTVARHPPVKPRRATERVDLHALVVRDRDGRLLLERGAFAYLSHLWLPLVEVGAAAPEELAEQGLGTVLARGAILASPERVQHAIVHRAFTVTVVAVRLAERAPASPLRLVRRGGERRWFAPAELESIGRSALLAKCLRAAGDERRYRAASSVT